MSIGLHHVAIFVADMERSIGLFRDVLGFELVRRLPSVGGRKLSTLLGLQDMKAELSFLQGRAAGTEVELVRLLQPDVENGRPQFGACGTVSLSFLVEDLDAVRDRVNRGGWKPFSSCVEMRTPQGEPMRAFCFATEEGITIELIEQRND